jgi:hypothetical protein
MAKSWLPPIPQRYAAVGVHSGLPYAEDKKIGLNVYREK